MSGNYPLYGKERICLKYYLFHRKMKDTDTYQTDIKELSETVNQAEFRLNH